MIVISLDARFVWFNIPSGKIISFVITDIIIPIEMYSIQIKKLDFISIFFENTTPDALHK